MKIIEIVFTEESKNDYNKLPLNLKNECSLLLHKLKKAGKKLGIPLENKNGKDLRGYYKLYFDNAKYRIIYTVVNDIIEIKTVDKTLKETLEITGIGKRDKEFIYKIIHQRINK